MHFEIVRAEAAAGFKTAIGLCSCSLPRFLIPGTLSRGQRRSYLRPLRPPYVPDYMSDSNSFAEVTDAGWTCVLVYCVCTIM
jgi:hypothetical protein